MDRPSVHIMKLRKGNMFDHLYQYECVLVTTNAMTRKDGALVMGRGAALDAAKRIPSLPYSLGNAIKNHPRYPDYGVVITSPIGGVWFGAFQVKHHWQDKAELRLIDNSCWKLMRLAEAFPSWTFAVNFPGIGNGGLAREEVVPSLDILLDNIDVWEL